MAAAATALYYRRRVANFAILSLSLLATAVGLIVLFLILWALLSRGVSALSGALFTQSTPAPGNQGGLLNAIYGSAVMTACATLLGTPVGILTGTFLAEFARGSRLAQGVRFVNDILLSAPSIVIGLFIYQVMVVRMGHFSAWAGTVALAIIVVPVVVRTTENMPTLVPASLREAAVALGAPQWKVVVMVVYRAAVQGMLTGVMLAIARIAGETAPLLFTALNNQFWSTDMNAPMGNLPVVIFQFALSPYADWQTLAWGGALLITLTILVLNILARFVASWSSFEK
jgi:phosphate transport system permease protein